MRGAKQLFQFGFFDFAAFQSEQKLGYAIHVFATLRAEHREYFFHRILRRAVHAAK
jgi:hypothetical protein